MRDAGGGNLFEVDTVQSVLHHVEHIAGKTYGENAMMTSPSVSSPTTSAAAPSWCLTASCPPTRAAAIALRRLLRRANAAAGCWASPRPFLVELVETVIQSSESAYPELREHDAHIKKVIGTEEATFARTIDAGMNILNNMIDGLAKRTPAPAQGSGRVR